MSPLVDELLEEGVPASVTCAVISDALATSGDTAKHRNVVSYRSWLRHRNGAVSEAIQARQERDAIIMEVSAQYPQHGARRIQRELEEKHNIFASPSTINRVRAKARSQD